MNWKLFDEEQPEYDGMYLCYNLHKGRYIYSVLEWDGKIFSFMGIPCMPPIYYCHIIEPIVR